MKRYKRLFAMLLAVVMVLGFAACGKKPADKVDEALSPENTAPQTENPPSVANPDEGPVSGEFVLVNSVDEVLARPHEIQKGTSVSFSCWDVPVYTPWNSIAETWMHRNIFEGLVYCYMGRPNDVRPLIAESYTHSEDYLTWVFQIREGVFFTDGNVCDAAAICASWEHFNSIAPDSFDNLNIISWEATAPMELTVKLSAPCGYIESAFESLYILSPEALTLYGPNDNKAAIGTGPYFISDYKPGDEFIFTANENYYLYERMPSIETVCGKIIVLNESKITAILDGTIDITTFSSPEVCASVIENGFSGTVLKGYGNAIPVWFNSKYVPELQIYEVRKAINRFIDLDVWNNNAYNGEGLVQTSLWSVGSSGEVPWPEGYYYDPDEGFELLSQAGLEPGDITLGGLYTSTSQPIYEAIGEQLNAVGMNFDMDPLEPEASFTPVMVGKYAFNCGSCGYTSFKPYLPWTFVLLPEHLIKMVWTDIYDEALYSEMCAAYESMMNASDWDSMLSSCHALTDMVQRDYAAMPGVQPPYYALFRSDIKGIVMVTENHDLLWNYLYL